MAHKKRKDIRVNGDVAYVPLSQGYETTIDANDVALVSGFAWYAHVTKKAVYAHRNDRSGPKQRTVSMHRTIMGEPDGMHVDHRDGNGLNNRRANIRIATRVENAQNRRNRSDNTSGFKGVGWSKAKGAWQARIRANGKRILLGKFETPEAAHAAYAEASALLHGEFGRTA